MRNFEGMTPNGGQEVKKLKRFVICERHQRCSDVRIGCATVGTLNRLSEFESFESSAYKTDRGACIHINWLSLGMA